MEHLPVFVTGKHVQQLLCATKIARGTKIDQATAVFELIKLWNHKNKIFGMAFETTSSNTRIKDGASIHKEKMIGRNLFHFTCKYHIFEIILKGAFNVQFGPTKWS